MKEESMKLLLSALLTGAMVSSAAYAGKGPDKNERGNNKEIVNDATGKLKSGNSPTHEKETREVVEEIVKIANKLGSHALDSFKSSAISSVVDGLREYGRSRDIENSNAKGNKDKNYGKIVLDAAKSIEVLNAKSGSEINAEQVKKVIDAVDIMMYQATELQKSSQAAEDAKKYRAAFIYLSTVAKVGTEYSTWVTNKEFPASFVKLAEKIIEANENRESITNDVFERLVKEAELDITRMETDCA